MQLNKTLNPINAEERVKINGNWDMISDRLSKLQLQINLLGGDTDVEAVIDRIQESIDAANNATTDTRAALSDLNVSLQQLNDLIQNGQNINQQVLDSLAEFNLLLNSNVYLGEYDSSFQYVKGNNVRLGKSTYVSLKNNTGLTPSDDGINWRLVAQGGTDGQGTVNTINGIASDSNGDVTITALDLGAAPQSELDALSSTVTSNKTDYEMSKMKVFNVRGYGARGNDSFNDTAAIKAAVTELNANGGGILYFPKGVYLVDSSIRLSQNSIVRGENQNSTFLKCHPDYSDTEGGVLVFRYDTNHCMGSSVYDISISTQQKQAHGLTMYSAYDAVVLENVHVDGLNANSSGIRLIPNPDIAATDPVSQTILMKNCMVLTNTNGGTAPLYLFDSVQEMNVIGCKGFSRRDYPSTIIADAPVFKMDGCRGIVYIGCSVVGGGANSFPFEITTERRDSNGIFIVGTTFESANKVISAIGSNGNIINNISLRDIRNEGSGSSTVSVLLNNVNRANIEVPFGTQSITNVTESMVITNRSVQYLQEKLSVYSSGVSSAEVTYPFSQGTSLFLVANDGTKTTLRRVELGALDSGGTGYRYLRVTN